MRIQITTPNTSFEYTPPAGRSNFTIGKRAGNDVILEGSETAANLHVRIESFINRWSFTDQFTDTGTLHNGERQFSHELQPGDVLTIGDCTVKVLSIGAATAPAAAVEESLTPMFDTGPDHTYVRPADDAAPAPPPSGHQQREASGAHVARVVKWALHSLTAEAAHALQQDGGATHRLEQAATNAVIELDSLKSTKISLPFITATASGPVHLDVTIERKHLHSNPPQHAAPARAPAAPRAAAAQGGDAFLMFENKKQASKKAWGSGLGGVLAGVILLVAAIGVVVANLEGSSDEVIPPGASQTKPPTEAELAREEAKKQKATEQELQALVRELMLDKGLPPLFKLDALIMAEAQAKEAGVNLGADGRRARSLFEQAVTTEVAREHQAAISEVYERRNEQDYVAAMQRIDAVEGFVAESPHRADPARRYSVPDWIERTRTEVMKDSDARLSDQLFQADILLARHDYAGAALVLASVLRCIMDDDDRALFKAEHAHCEAMAQPGSGAPDVIRPFDRSKDRLPPGNTGKLIHSGESGARSRWNNMRSNLTNSMFEGSAEAIRGSALGRKFLLQGAAGRSECDLFIARPHGAREWEYRVRVRFANLPPEVQFEAMNATERTELAELMAMLVFCFDNGLTDQAGLMAARVRAAAPEHEDALNTYLAAKWKAEIPEGGFPERDGRIVRE